MGEEAQKRNNTDCVYFLASPLTCKKGSDCEYRHSEAARLNPRDCWYWLSGNCLNADCSFRHPPLDGRPDAALSSSSRGSAAVTISAVTSSSSSAVHLPPTTSKSAVPCFFFSQGFCSKGSKCPFSHGPLTHFRKEGTTYRKFTEQATSEGNGLLSAKSQVQDSKQALLMQSVAKAAKEPGFTPSNVYKRIVHGNPPSSAPSGKQLIQRTNQSSKVKQIYGVGDNLRQGQPVATRIPQVQVRDENLQQLAIADRSAGRGQSNQQDLYTEAHTQGKHGSLIQNARSGMGFMSSEMQEWTSEQEAHLSLRELDASDLRNHLKRKKNETAYVSRNFAGMEQPKDRLESKRLASRAVVVGDSKDFVEGSSSKRVKQEKEASTFTGPKTLAQIKAEKSKPDTEVCLNVGDVPDNSRSQARANAEIKRERSPPEPCYSSCLKSCENGKENVGDKSAVEEHKALEMVVKNKVLDLPRASMLHSQEPVGPPSSKSMPGKAVREAEEKQRDGKLTVNLLGNKEVFDGGNQLYQNLVSSEDNGPKVGFYNSADDTVEDGTEALENTVDAEYLSDFEEDDFAKKLSSFA